MANSRSKLVHRNFGEEITLQTITTLKINQLKIHGHFSSSFAQMSKHKITYIMGKRLILSENSACLN